MTVHNGEVHLRESIASILGQSFHDFEFLIINDASTDRTRELILSYDDRRIRLIENSKKLGQTRSLNRGLQLARGEWIARQDADDISEPDRLVRQAAFLASNRKTALVGTWYKKIDARSAELGTRELPCNWLQIRWALLFLCPFVHSSTMLRKTAVLQKVGFYNEAFVYAQDYDLWSRIATHLPVVNLPEYLVQYRVSPGSMTSTYGEIVQDETRRTSIANLAVLIGRDEATRLVFAEAEFANISALLFGDYRRLSPEEAIAASRRIIWLLHAFLRQFENESRDGKLQAEIRSRIASRFVEIGHRRIDETFHLVNQLVLEAHRLHWPLVFTRRSLGLFWKLIKRQVLGTRTAAHG